MKKKFNKELKNVWSVLTLLVELAGAWLLGFQSTHEEGLLRNVLIAVAAVLGANALVKLYLLTRKK